VDFFWINRDQYSFEWFLSLLRELEVQQSEHEGVFSEHFLDMHIYMTSALRKQDMKALGLQLALELLHEKKERDLITGLRTRTNAGRPDWEEVGFDNKRFLSVLCFVNSCIFQCYTSQIFDEMLNFHYSRNHHNSAFFISRCLKN
jgi:hypothetical protein